MHLRYALLCFLLFGGLSRASEIPSLDAKAGSEPFLKLRLAYAAAPEFTGGWVSDPKREALLSLYESDPKAFLDQSAEWLKKCPVDAKVHLMRGGMLIKQGDLEGGVYHRLMFNGLLGSIVASGNGATLATAYKVISVDEEYTVLNYLGADVKRQTLESSCDKMDVEIGGVARTIYFDASIPLMTEQRLLDEKHKK